MARPIRIEFPGAVYHIFTRGNRQEDIFLDDKDRVLFLKLLSSTVDRLNWVCHAYCLMSNHDHLLIKTPEGLLSKGMQYLNSNYSRKFNRKYELRGHLFEKRYTAKLRVRWGQGVNCGISDKLCQTRLNSYSGTKSRSQEPGARK